MPTPAGIQTVLCTPLSKLAYLRAYSLKRLSAYGRVITQVVGIDANFGSR